MNQVPTEVFAKYPALLDRFLMVLHAPRHGSANASLQDILHSEWGGIVNWAIGTPREQFDAIVRTGSHTSSGNTYSGLQRYVLEKIGYKANGFVDQQALFMDLQEHSPELFDCKNPIKEANLARSIESQIGMVTRCRRCAHGRKEVLGDDGKKRLWD